ncbi:hypothetical protein ZIOFF_034792 [Zingiber officinale]|uniref:Uncharacterized protein n=1 Tax=Zingiber officinale TaxID=94328 RepID=A0A8J5L6C5_ZINOF|nr:hypothetical protein ZIOFF_034792 [Zingiber officinale]
MALLPKFSSPPFPGLQKPSHRLPCSPPAAFTKLDLPPPSLSLDAVQEKKPLSLPHGPPFTATGGGSGGGSGNGHRSEFYLNVGLAVRTLRDDLPALFARDLNYDIYREDIVFIDPLNTFHGVENYRLIFWAVRFHGKILFKEIKLRIFRVWQPSENIILIRWELEGVPRVPWEARGTFQGTSWYKLDRNGKIYEHKVDNVALNFPQAPIKPVTMMDFVAAACPPSPNLTFSAGLPEDNFSWRYSSWSELYRAVRSTLELEGKFPEFVGIEAGDCDAFLEFSMILPENHQLEISLHHYAKDGHSNPMRSNIIACAMNRIKRSQIVDPSTLCS